jgi:AcrR family transcriptional regulator
MSAGDTPSPRRASQRERGLRRAQSDATRQKILDAALKAFSERGFDGASTRDITDAAGVNQAMIGYHFASKEDLWRATVDLLFSRMRQELGDRRLVGSRLAEEEGWRETLRAYVHYCARHPEHARLMVQESIRGGPRLDWMVARYIAPGHASGKPFFDTLSPSTAQAPMHRTALIYIIVAACQIPYLLAAEIHSSTGFDTRSEAFIDAHVDMLFELFETLTTGGAAGGDRPSTD